MAFSTKLHPPRDTTAMLPRSMWLLWSLVQARGGSASTRGAVMGSSAEDGAPAASADLAAAAVTAKLLHGWLLLKK
jgi:hypothetical protein